MLSWTMLCISHTCSRGYVKTPSVIVILLIQDNSDCLVHAKLSCCACTLWQHTVAVFLTIDAAWQWHPPSAIPAGILAGHQSGECVLLLRAVC